MSANIRELPAGHSDAELMIKRLYLPFEVSDSCPDCPNTVVKDLSQDYLSYPRLGQHESVCMWCEECDAEWDVSVVLTMSLVLAKPEEKS